MGERETLGEIESDGELILLFELRYGIDIPLRIKFQKEAVNIIKRKTFRAYDEALRETRVEATREKIKYLRTKEAVRKFSEPHDIVYTADEWAADVYKDVENLDENLEPDEWVEKLNGYCSNIRGNIARPTQEEIRTLKLKLIREQLRAIVRELESASLQKPKN